MSVAQAEFLIGDVVVMDGDRDDEKHVVTSVDMSREFPYAVRHLKSGRTDRWTNSTGAIKRISHHDKTIVDLLMEIL